MGMIDNYGKFAIDQAITATGDTVSTNIYDSGSIHSADIGLNDELWINAVCSEKVTSGGAATVQAVLQTSDDSTTWVDALAGQTIPVAQLDTGTALLQAKVPVGLKRYTRIAWRVGTAALTAGTFSAFFSKDVQNNIARPSGFKVE